MIKDPALVFKKKIVIWGAGKKGTELYLTFTRLIAGRYLADGQVSICDADADRLRSQRDYPILTIDEMAEKIRSEKEAYLIVVSPEAIKVQDEIIEQIKRSGLSDVDICTLFGITWALIFAERTEMISMAGENLGVTPMGGNGLRNNTEIKKQRLLEEGSHLNEWLLIYQPGKVGSNTVYRSLKEYGKHSFHIHWLMGIENIREILQEKKAKIITMVRNPIEQWMSKLWHWNMLERQFVDQPDKDFDSIEEVLMDDGDLFSGQVYWFQDELEQATGIDIWDYPFDREQGYTIIEKDGIELLLLKCERLNELEGVIGTFAGIEDFKLRSSNVGEQKPYRFAYRDYKKGFRISRERFEKIFNDKRLCFFYTDTEIQDMRAKWEPHVVEEDLHI